MALPSLLWKVCCIASIDEARAALAAGADVLGLVGEMPSGPGVLTDEAIAEIVRGLRASEAESWLLTSRTEARSIAAHVHAVGTSGVQIVGTPEAGVHERLRELLPLGTRVVQVIHVEGEEAIEEALETGPHVDALLLDSGRPKAGVLGGTGEVHDWGVSRRLVRELRSRLPDLPVWLAGGLRPENLAEAVGTVQPSGLDLCSGLRTDGALDPVKLDQFRSGLLRCKSRRAFQG